LFSSFWRSKPDAAANPPRKCDRFVTTRMPIVRANYVKQAEQMNLDDAKTAAVREVFMGRVEPSRSRRGSR
jgi:hypothetical protein